LAFKSNEKSSTTHHAEGNSMANPTEMVVGKDMPNPLIAKGLLKILRNLIPPSPPKPLPIPVHGMIRPQKVVIVSLAK